MATTILLQLLLTFPVSLHAVGTDSATRQVLVVGIAEQALVVEQRRKVDFRIRAGVPCLPFRFFLYFCRQFKFEKWIRIQSSVCC